MRIRLFQNQLQFACKSLLVTIAYFSLHGADVFGFDSSRNTPVVKAIKRAEPAVVNIQGNKTITNASSSGGPSKQEVNGMGTGVIIDRRGFIITNYHVVDEVNRIEVTLADGTTAIAKLLKHDNETDLALIKIPTNRDLPVIDLGRSEDLLRGESVIAIGNPFGYQNTVTVGIISALHRDIPVNGSQQYHDLIQTNADINPGNSGGPLLNIDGEVIGINVAVRVGAQGIGFAIPIDTAMEVMADLVADYRQSGGLGLKFARSAHETGSQLVVREATASDFQDSQLRSGDLVDSVEGKAVRNRLELEFALLDKRDGEQVEIGIQRDGVRLAHSVTLEGGKANLETDTSEAAWEQLGIRLTSVSASAVAGLGEDYKGGLRITEIRQGSPADRARLAAGDIIVGVMDWQTPKLESLAWIMNNPSFRQAASSKYYLIRKRSRMTVPISLESSTLSSISRNGSKDIR